MIKINLYKPIKKYHPKISYIFETIFFVLFVLTFISSFAESKETLHCADYFETAKRLQIRDFFINNKHFTRADYLKTISDNLDVNNAARYHPREDITSHVNYDKILKALENYPESFKALLVDFGVLNHAKEVIQFFNQCSDCKARDPWEVRAMLSQFMGKEIVYRAVYINETIAKNISEKGFRGKVFTSTESMYVPENIERLEFQSWELLRSHMKRTNNSPLMSVTKYPDLAVAVAKKFADPQIKKGRVYLYKLEIPKLDLLHLPEYDTPYAHLQSEILLFQTMSGPIKKYPIDARLESLVLYKILPEEIKSVEKIDVKNHTLAKIWHAGKHTVKTLIGLDD